MEYLVLAYLGDAVYELYVRKFLISLNIMNVNELQTRSLEYVSAKSQRRILEDLISKNYLKSNELDIVNKGRNVKMHKSKNNDVITYHKATGFECLIGYLYQNDINRLNELMEEIL